MERVEYLLLSNFDSQVNAGKVINVVKKLFLLVSVLISSSLLLGFDSFCSIDKELNKDTAKKLKELETKLIQFASIVPVTHALLNHGQQKNQTMQQYVKKFSALLPVSRELSNFLKELKKARR